MDLDIFIPALSTAVTAIRITSYNVCYTKLLRLVSEAEKEEVEIFAFYAFVPAYDFAQPNLFPQGVRIENDFKAWYELVVRFNHMFDLNFKLSDLEKKTQDLIQAMDPKIEEFRITSYNVCYTKLLRNELQGLILQCQ